VLVMTQLVVLVVMILLLLVAVLTLSLVAEDQILSMVVLATIPFMVVMKLP